MSVDVITDFIGTQRRPDSGVSGSPPAGLPEFRFYLPRPGHPDWQTLMSEADEMVSELAPRLQLPERGRRELRRRLAAFKTTGSNFLLNWRRNRKAREDLLPLYFIWTTTRACNFSCVYCDDHQSHKYPDLPNDDVLDTAAGKRLLKVMRTRTPSVYLAGGEPMVREDLAELTRYARELKYYPIIVNTNGSLVHSRLKKAEWADWLANTDIIVVSLDGLRLEGLRDLWVFKRPETVIRNLLFLWRLADRMGVKLMVNTVIDPSDLESARDVLDFANDMGIWFCPVPMNVGSRIHPDLRNNPEYRALAETILARKRSGHRISGSLRMNERMLRSQPFNCRNTLKPHIDYDGRVVWPCKSTMNVSPEYVDVLEHDSVDDLFDAACKRVSPHDFHGPASNQCGGDCNWAQNYTTDAYVHGLNQPLSLLGEVTEFLSRR